jgi:hypothetical protein
MTEQQEKETSWEYYAVMAQYYLFDGMYDWHEVDEYCPTLKDALECLQDQKEGNPQYVDFRIDHHIVTEVVPPTMGYEDDFKR